MSIGNTGDISTFFVCGIEILSHTPNIHAINVDVKIRWSTVYFHAQGFHIALRISNKNFLFHFSHLLMARVL